MKKIFFILFASLSTMTYAQENITQEPVLTGIMAAAMVQAAFAEANRDGLHVTITVVDKSGQTLAVLRHTVRGYIP